MSHVFSAPPIVIPALRRDPFLPPLVRLRGGPRREAGVTNPSLSQCLWLSANAFFWSAFASFWCFFFHSSYGMP